MELFVFLRMGGSKDDISMRLAVMADQAPAVMEKLSTFDAAKAQCFLDKDRQHLLAVIESTFGTFTAFNKIMRAIALEKVDVSSCGNAGTVSGSEIVLEVASV